MNYTIVTDCISALNLVRQDLKMKTKAELIELFYLDYMGKEVKSTIYKVSRERDLLLSAMRGFGYGDNSIKAVIGFIDGTNDCKPYMGIFHDGKRLFASGIRNEVELAAANKIKAMDKIQKLGIIGCIRCNNATYRINENGTRIINIVQDGGKMKRCSVIYGKGIVILLYDGNLTDVFSGDYAIHNK